MLIIKGEDLRRKREELNLTQKQLAEILGISYKTIQNYENGAIIPKSKNVLLRNFIEGNVKENNISVTDNAGGVAGNNIINIALPEEGTQKIIKPDGTTIVESLSSKDDNNRNKDFFAKIEELQLVIALQNKLIESYEITIKTQQKTIELLTAKGK